MTAADPLGLLQGAHACPGQACGHQVIPEGMVLCRNCWKRLPRAARKGVYAAHDQHQREPTQERAGALAYAGKRAIQVLHQIEKEETSQQ